MMRRPVPTGDFSWIEGPNGAVLRCGALHAVAPHAFTSKQLELPSNQPGADAWNRVVAAVGCELPALRRVRQVHGAAVRVVDDREPPPVLDEADALVTNTPGVAVAVVTADCVPVLLADSATGAVAAVHAGWRGTAADVAGAAVATLTREYGVRADRLIAAIGPSIGACCYDVGEELLPAFIAAGRTSIDLAEWFVRDRAGRLRLDLWRANEDLLVRAGLQRANVHVAGLCTKTHADVFESFRADGARAGRMAAIIVAPKGSGRGTKD